VTPGNRNWSHDFGIPVGGVIVNLVIDKQGVKPDAPDFVRNRIAMLKRTAEHRFAGWPRTWRRCRRGSPRCSSAPCSWPPSPG
jgi:hypothetical protein